MRKDLSRKEEPAEKLVLVPRVEEKNRHSAAYFFVTAICAVAIVELVRFLVRLKPIEGQVYYQIFVYWDLLPQVIALAGSVYLIFECYRRISLLFLDTQARKAISVSLMFLMLLSIYIFGFVKPGYWMFVVGFNLLILCIGCCNAYISFKMRLKEAGIEDHESSKWVIHSALEDWIKHTFIYGVFILLAGFGYAPIMRTIELNKVSMYGLHLTPVIVNYFALLVLFFLGGAAYYWSPFRKNKPRFSKEATDQLKQNLEKIYTQLKARRLLKVD